MAEFKGFSPEVFVFLRELAEHNSRTWFNDNKDRYVKLAKEPTLQFITAMGGRLEKISSSYIADPRANGGSMFRIYRDTRFSKDKSPYKENIGCQFRHSAGKDVHAPGYYIHIQPGGSFAGGGIWRPPTPVLSKVRDAIVRKPEEWTALKKYLTQSVNVSEIQGERLKNPPRGYDPDHSHGEDLKLKSFYVGRDFADDEVTSPSFIDSIDRLFHDILPFMTFLTQALSLSS